MSTIAPDVDSHLDRMAALTGNPRDNFGSAADSSHLSSGGYHCGAFDLKRINAVGRDDYSIRQPRDRAFYNWELAHASDLAAAIDYDDDWRNGGRAAWIRFNNILRRQLGAKDPALAAVRGMNYTPDGTAKRRFDCLTGQETSTSDTVTWHTHLEWWRDTVGQASRARAIRRIEQIAVAAIHNTPLPAEAAAAAPPQEVGSMTLYSITDGASQPKGTIVGKDANGDDLVHDSRCVATPNGPVALPYGSIIDAWNTYPKMFLPISLADLGKVCKAMRQPPATLDQAQVKQAIQEALDAVNADPGNEVNLSAGALASVADAVTTRIGQKLGTVQP